MNFGPILSDFWTHFDTPWPQPITNNTPPTTPPPTTQNPQERPKTDRPTYHNPPNPLTIFLKPWPGGMRVSDPPTPFWGSTQCWTRVPGSLNTLSRPRFPDPKTLSFRWKAIDPCQNNERFYRVSPARPPLAPQCQFFVQVVGGLLTVPNIF